MATTSLIFVHLSDIHFRAYPHSPQYDPNVDIRRKLLEDAKRARTDAGAVAAVLLSGDIAYGGKVADYKLASEWLTDLLGVVQAPPTAICCVPGNHDVDRDALNKRTWKDARKSLRTCSVERIDQEILAFLPEAEVFYGALDNYNEFAVEWDCHCTKDHPVWRRSYAIDGQMLAVHGLNSVLASDHDDKNTSDDRKLVLGRHQYAINDESAPNFVLCHHPLDWLRDGEQAEEVLNARAMVQLFGHKHKHRLRRIDNTVRINSGAAGPCPREPDWTPRYNWLRIEIVTGQDSKLLRVQVWPRIWSEGEQKFIPDSNSCGATPNRSFDLQFVTVASPAAVEAMTPPEKEAGVVEILQTASTGSEAMEASRVLAHRYFSLSYVQKMRIAQELGLLTEDDRKLAGIQLFLAHLRRAKEQHLLRQLWDKVQEAHDDSKYTDNPYVK